MDPQIKTWSVIKFPDEEAVSAVPTSWLHEGDKCYWPPYNKVHVRAAIEKNETPDKKSWQSFPCSGFRNNVYDNFKEANRKSIKATNTSDLESDNNTYLMSSKKRKIFRKTFSFSSTEEEDISNISNFPQLKKRKVSDINTEDSFNIPLCPALPEGSQISTSQAQVMHSNKIRETENNERIKDSDVIIKYLEQIIRKQNIIQSMIADMNTRISHLEINRDIDNIQNNGDSIFITLQNLPVNSAEHLDDLERFLSEDAQMQMAVNEMSFLGGSNVYDFVFRATQKLITNQFCGTHYSYLGKRNKKAFSILKLKELLIKSSMKLFPSATINDIEKDVGKWLRRCSERAKN